MAFFHQEQTGLGQPVSEVGMFSTPYRRTNLDSNTGQPLVSVVGNGKCLPSTSTYSLWVPSGELPSTPYVHSMNQMFQSDSIEMARDNSRPIYNSSFQVNNRMKLIS